MFCKAISTLLTNSEQIVLCEIQFFNRRKKKKQPTNQTNKNMHSYADVSAIWITVIKYGEEAVSAFQVYSMPVQLA